MPRSFASTRSIAFEIRHLIKNRPRVTISVNETVEERSSAMCRTSVAKTRVVRDMLLQKRDVATEAYRPQLIRINTAHCFKLCAFWWSADFVCRVFGSDNTDGRNRRQTATAFKSITIPAMRINMAKIRNSADDTSGMLRRSQVVALS